LFADCASLTGDLEAGIAALQRARKTIPDSPVIAIQAGIILYHARRNTELLDYATVLTREHPDLPLAHWLRGLALEQQSNYPEAMRAIRECLRLSPRDVRAIPELGRLQALTGRRQDASGLIESARGYSGDGWIGPTGIALIHAALDNRDVAFTWLDEAYRQREGALPYLKVDPRFDSLRSDPRFAALLKKLSL